jgi:Fic family protein
MRLSLLYNRNDDRLQGLLEFMDRRRYVVRALVPEGYESYFQEQARYISAHMSTAIEGNPMNEEQAMLVLVEGADGDDPASLEKVNLEEAYELMAGLTGDKSTKIDEGIIRTINSIALKSLPEHKAENRGRYRVSQNLIVDAATREVRYRPPPPEHVPELMAKFIVDLNKWMRDESPPIAAALAHFGIISIHPFDDGNGRTARLVADMVLDLKEWSVEAMLSVSSVVFGRRDEYYEALRSAQGERFLEEVDTTPFVLFHTEALVDAAATLEEKVVIFNRRKDTWMRTMDILKARQVTALMFMMDIGPLSSSTYARLAKSSQSSALADLSEMVDRRFAIRDGAGRSTRYQLAPRLVEVVRSDEGRPERA